MKTHISIHIIIKSMVVGIVMLLTGCVTEEEFANTKQGNFDALWNIVDQHYCFFQYKQEQNGLNWDSVRQVYQQKINSNLTVNQFFDVCGDMLRQLQDGHVTLTSPFNTARYWDWFENYPANFSDSLERKYLGTDYRLVQGLKYRKIDDIGYIRCSSFEYTFGTTSLSYILAYFSTCKGLIIDIRNNGGGLLTSAKSLAECFIENDTIGGYICHKTGTGHNDFSSPQAITLSPSPGVHWNKPVVIITNRHCYSAANTFVMYMKACTRATILGDKTGGGCGMPFTNEMPIGWKIRFSAVPMYDVNMQITEGGIEPHIKVNLEYADLLQGKDTMIESAIAHLKGNQ